MAGCSAVSGLICLVKNFDKNSHVRFYKHMVAANMQKSVMHGFVHGRSYINC